MLSSRFLLPVKGEKTVKVKTVIGLDRDVDLLDSTGTQTYCCTRQRDRLTSRG